MTSLDLHPEELLDKRAAGTLSEQEREHLDAHLKACGVCRFELQAKLDFAAVPMVDLNVDGLVSRALSGLPTAAPRPALAAGGRRSGAWLVAAVVALSAFGSFAAVGQWTGVLPRVLAALRTPEPEVVAPVPVPRARPVPQVVPEAELTPPPPPPMPEPEPQPEVVKRPVKAAPKSVVAAPAVGLEAPVDPASLFDLANQARIRGDRYEATRRYKDLLARFPEAPEARLTRATLGRLLLDSGEATAALEQLDAYLQSGDESLREEALAARAQALGRLGRDADEAQAWRTLTDRYPQSIHTARARARLEALSH